MTGKRRFVSLSKGKTPLGYPDDLPFGAHPMDWYLVSLRNLLGPARAARYIGVEPSEIDRHNQARRDRT